MTVDAHVHLWNRATDPQDWIDPATMPQLDRDFGPAELAEMLARSSADAAVVVQASNSAAETRRLLALEGPVAGVVGWIDLTAPAEPQLAGLEGPGRPLVGIRHLVHLDPDPEWLGGPQVGRGLDALAAAGLGYDLVLRATQLPLAARVADEHPAVRFALDHLGGVGETDDLAGWERAVRELAFRPRVTAKISGLWRIADDGDRLRRVVGVALEAFGPERLMYGSDWPLAELGAGAVAWRRTVDELIAALAPAERERILTGTAVEHYGLAR